MRYDKEGKSSTQRNEEITNKNKWEYEEEEVIIWRNEYYEEKMNKSQRIIRKRSGK